MELGRLLASGRAADVYDLGDGTVLRRYRVRHDVTDEARLMSWLADQGYPVPVVHHAEGRDLVMDKIAGPTMLEDLQRKPWRLVAHARLLARLQGRLNAVTAPEWLPVRAGVTAGTAVLHLDFHPMNVILSDAGPIVIDWTNASRGEGSFDAAMTAVLVSTSEIAGVRDRVGQRLFTALFSVSRGRCEISRSLAAAATYRLDDVNVTDSERERVRHLVDG